MAFKPLGKRVLIRREEQSNTTASGLIIPDTAKEKSLQGKVLAVGAKANKAGINIGDTVVFGKFINSTEVTVDNEVLLILNSDDIYGIID